MDKATGLIRVGGRLRQLEGQADVSLHPIVLKPSHPVTRLLIRRYDEDLHHPGPEGVFAELRWSYWIVSGRKAVHQHQCSCAECQRWRAQPAVPKMADLPSAHLEIHKPAFCSSSVDCFTPMAVTVVKCQGKRLGVIFKCLTTRAVHLDYAPKYGCRCLPDGTEKVHCQKRTSC